MKARELAFTALLKMDRAGSYSNLTLDAVLEGEAPWEADRRLASQLFYGVLERKLTLDYALSRYLKQKPEKLDPEVRIAMELGAYQLLYLSGIPQSAAVNESVNLVKRSKKRSAAGFVNGVLRSFLRDGCRIILPEGDWTARASVETGMPPEILRLWERDYSRDMAVKLAENCLGRPPLHFRVNPLRASVQEAAESLMADGAKVTVHETIPNCLEVSHTGSVAGLKAFQQGLAAVQDSASQLCALAVGAKPGERVFDLCAAPGSKSFVMAQEMKNQGEILAFDLYESRAGLNRQGAERLGLTIIQAKSGDAAQYDSSIGMADRVLCDVPCSGLGIIRRKPEIRWKSAEEIAALPPIQRAILENAARYVKPGGILVYSTCSLHRAENEEVIQWFLERHPEIEPAPFEGTAASICGNGDWQATLTPMDGFDGFFIARMRRR